MKSTNRLAWILAFVILVVPTVHTLLWAQPDEVTLADELTMQGLRLYQSGKATDAIPLLKQARVIREQVLGPNHPATATSLSNLGVIYQAIGDYAHAESLHQRALAVHEKSLGSDHYDTATDLNNLGSFYQATGDYTRAEPLHKRALAIHKKVLGPEHPDTARSQNNLAELYRATGVYGEAELLHQTALKIREKKLGPTHPITAISLSNLALLYSDMGLYEQAEPLYQQALAIREKSLSPDHPDTATTLNNLASLYQATEAYGRAEPLYQRALEIVLRVFGPAHPTTAMTIGNLGGLYQVSGAYEKAEQFNRRALAIAEQVFGQSHPITATALSNLGLLYRTTGEYAAAEQLYKRALAINEKVFGLEHPHTALNFNNLSGLAWAQGHEADALKYLKHAARIEDANVRRLLMQGDEVRKRAYVAKLQAQTDVTATFAVAFHTATARSLGLEVILQRKGLVLDVLADNLQRIRRSLATRDQALLVSYQAATTAWATLNTRGPGPLPIDQYRDRLAELHKQITDFESQLSNQSKRFRAEIDPIRVEHVQKSIPDEAVLIEWVHYHPFNPRALKQAAKWGLGRYAVYLLKPTGPPVLKDVGEAAAIDTAVAELLAVVRHAAGMKKREALAKELYRRLVQPIHADLKDAKKLFLSPDGQLNLFPFGMLQNAEGQYLADQYEITYLTSGRDLLRPAVPAKTFRPMLLVADPEFGPLDTTETVAPPATPRSANIVRGSLRFESLGGTAQEAEALKILLKLKPSQLLTKEGATETAVKQVHRPRILHLATHGFFLSDLPVDLNALSRGAGFAPVQWPPAVHQENPLLRSGLALAGANQLRSGPHDDGILTALEVTSLDLEGTELAVLSACETGVGDVHNGEGVYGLRRALVLAGVRTQVVSLWKVDDAATKEFMVAYYKHVQAGLGRSAALRTVQRVMRDNPKRAHPYYWAAFVVIGDAAPLPPQHRKHNDH